MKYIDKSYIDKRQELRRFFHEQPIAYSMIAYIVHNVNLIKYQHLSEIIGQDLRNIIKSLLVDGYLAYERVYLNMTNKYSFLQLDPCYIYFTRTDWEIRYPNEIIRKIKKNDLVYISYSDISYTDHTSLIEQMMITGLSLDVHKKYIDVLIDRIPSIFEKFDSNYYRRKKLLKITKDEN